MQFHPNIWQIELVQQCKLRFISKFIKIRVYSKLMLVKSKIDSTFVTYNINCIFSKEIFFTATIPAEV